MTDGKKPGRPNEPAFDGMNGPAPRQQPQAGGGHDDYPEDQGQDHGMAQDFIQDENVVVAGAPDDIARVKAKLSQQSQAGQGQSPADHLGGKAVAHCCGKPAKENKGMMRPLKNFMSFAFKTKKRGLLTMVTALMLYNSGPTVVMGSIAEGGPMGYIQVERENIYSGMDHIERLLEKGADQYGKFSDREVASVGGKVNAKARRDARYNAGMAIALEFGADVAGWVKDHIGKKPSDWQRRENRPENPLADMAESFGTVGQKGTGGNNGASSERPGGHMMDYKYKGEYEKGRARAAGRQSVIEEEQKRIEAAREALENAATKTGEVILDGKETDTRTAAQQMIRKSDDSSAKTSETKAQKEKSSVAPIPPRKPSF